MQIPHSSGVQLHITSLPSGTLGGEAYRFVDWLAAAGQSYWQVLPLGPPDRWGSPYKSRSAFACWPRLLERPEAPVSAGEEADFRERQAFWISDWERAGRGREVVRDQVRFEREWLALRTHAAESGVKLVGDLPLYVAGASVDHRAHPRIFSEGMVAGAPPDEYTAKGQRWGNPLYDWPRMRRGGYRWWVERIRRAVELFDVVRLDHFRGLIAYWAIPAGARDARQGHWHRGPGGAPLVAAREALGGRLPLIAEDLGVITPPVERLRAQLGIPGMAVLEFVYGAREDDQDPLAAASRGRVLYTATHDQDTLVGWWESLQAPVRRSVLAALGEHDLMVGRHPGRALIELALSAPAPLVMMQAQDVLGLPGSARMNTPGRASGNWSWRATPGAFEKRLGRWLHDATARAGRLQ